MSKHEPVVEPVDTGDSAEAGRETADRTHDAGTAADRAATGAPAPDPEAPAAREAELPGEAPDQIPDRIPDQIPDQAPAELQAELEAQREQVLRLQAEIENLRKRAKRDVENAHKFGIERLVAELLPVKDSMELGLQAAEQEGADVESLKEGTALTLKMLMAALGKFDVEEVDPLGAPFDPELHQAMSMQEIAGVEPGQVVTVVQKGYTLAKRLVRPAMVIVSK